MGEKTRSRSRTCKVTTNGRKNCAKLKICLQSHLDLIQVTALAQNERLFQRTWTFKRCWL